jgi:hypothetical protein
MRFDYQAFHIDCRARHDEDGLFYARARITRAPADSRTHGETFESGDLDGFTHEADAVACARSWAIEWCDENAR